MKPTISQNYQSREAVQHGQHKMKLCTARPKTKNNINKIGRCFIFFRCTRHRLQIKSKAGVWIYTPVGLLDTSSGGCGLASGLCGQLLAGCLAAGRLAGCLLGASHLTFLLLAEGN